MYQVAVVVLLAILFGPLSGSARAGIVESTFDAGDEGWTITGDAQGASVIPDWHASGGNPGGYISADDDVRGGTWYYKAPAKFRGNHSSAYGDTLSYDLRQDPPTGQFNNVEIHLRGGGLSLTYETSHPAVTWTPYSVDLTESGGWLIGGVAPNQAQMQQVLANITDLQIRGEFRSGADTGSMDNVVMTPEPATLIMLVLGGVGAITRRRRR
jgi:hypothetical protein